MIPVTGDDFFDDKAYWARVKERSEKHLKHRELLASQFKACLPKSRKPFRFNKPRKQR